jgi:signal transduction histidine kinase
VIGPGGPRRLSVKLGLVLFLAVAFALAIVYLAALPRLESRLVNAKLRELERSAQTVSEVMAETNRFLYQDAASVLGSSLNVRVVVYDRLTPRALRPIADSSGRRSTDVQRNGIALRAAETGMAASGRTERDGASFAEVAAPVGAGAVVLLAAPLRDALATVRLVRRTLVIAGAVALLVAGLAGFLAAWSISRRVGQLERAAERIAAGDFDAPVVVGGSDEIAQLGEAFEAMRLRLEHLDRARREFIANASHELRTPIFSLGGFLELLDDEDLDDATRRDFLTEMRAQLERLTRLATDLLDLSRLDADQLAVTIDDVDLTALARTLVDEFRAVAESEEHELSLAVETPVRASGDEQRVLQIGRILVENAVRHTAPGTAVTVSVGRWEARAILRVRDSGAGIPAADQDHLFERFYRVGGDKASGSGLGLAIARELAGKMGGTLKVASQPGNTAFTLSLPLTGSPARVEGEPAAAPVST